MMKINYIFGAVVLAALAFSATTATAQNVQSARNASKMHKNLLAKQSRIQDQIRLDEAQKYARGLYEEEEPEPDIYTEGWESGLVNPFNESDVPNTKVINVRNYVMPVKSNYVTSHYGYRPRFGRNHKGVDLRAAMGDTVRSAFSGRVRLTKFERNGFGFYVIVRHENGLETVYGHLSRFLVQPNQYVKAGQPIALSGNTGRSTGPHLHFETRFMGYAINPEAIFDFERRVTHTDTYTFNKSSYAQSRSYTPSRSSSASVAPSKSYGHHSSGHHSSSKSSSAQSKYSSKSSSKANTKVAQSKTPKSNKLAANSKKKRK